MNSKSIEFKPLNAYTVHITKLLSVDKIDDCPLKEMFKRLLMLRRATYEL